MVEAGTEGAPLLLFDPKALPEDFDAPPYKERRELFGELAAAGKAFFIDKQGDGFYLMHAYVDESPPTSLQPFLRDPVTGESLAAPSGRLYLTGAEYAFREDERLLQENPAMGSFFTVRPGVYRVTLWTTEDPEAVLRQQVSRGPYRLYQGRERLGNVGCLGFVAVFLSRWVLSLETWCKLCIAYFGLWVLWTQLCRFCQHIARPANASRLSNASSRQLWPTWNFVGRPNHPLDPTSSVTSVLAVPRNLRIAKPLICRVRWRFEQSKSSCQRVLREARDGKTPGCRATVVQTPLPTSAQKPAQHGPRSKFRAMRVATNTDRYDFGLRC